MQERLEIEEKEIAELTEKVNSQKSEIKQVSVLPLPPV